MYLTSRIEFNKYFGIDLKFFGQVYAFKMTFVEKEIYVKG